MAELFTRGTAGAPDKRGDALVSTSSLNFGKAAYQNSLPYFCDSSMLSVSSLAEEVGL